MNQTLWSCQHPVKPPKGAVPGHGPTLTLLDEMLNPRKTPIRALRDPVLVSLDLEYNSKPPAVYQIGLTILDTLRLPSIDTKDIQTIRSAVTSHLILTRKRRCRAYCYGDPVVAENTEIADILRPYLMMKDHQDALRNIILVGHTIYNDLGILEDCGLDLNNLAMVKAYIDIAPACSRHFGHGHHPMSLKHICQHFKIRTFSYHNAAHDALYTLQALLKLFCAHKEQELASPWTTLSGLEAEMEDDRRTWWEYQLDFLRLVGEEAGNALWTGTAANRQRRRQKEEYLASLEARGLQVGASDVQV